METLKNYIGGKWMEAEGAATLDVENPATGETLAKVPLSGPDEIDRAVRAAAEAFPEWSRTPADKRVGYLFRLVESLRKDEEEIVHALVREMGKSIPDARAEMKRTFENIETACGMPVLQQGDKLANAAAGIDGEVLRLPIGVFGMIPPFNFPAMVPFWFLPYAIGAGNTYVLKPSEQVPMTMRRIAERIHETGLPAGVFNLVNGDKNTVSALVGHPGVAGISFVGSSAVARDVAVRCAASGKRVQALGGAKNHLVVMPDARMDEVVRNAITSCYGCAGQRCMAASAVVCVGDAVRREFVERFVEESKRTLVADPLDPAVAGETTVVGPVISALAKERILGLIEDGVREGAELALDGRGIVVKGKEKGHYVGPTVFVNVKPGMKVHRTEIFGPVVVVLEADTLDEAIRIVNGHEYGNGASVYTQSGYWARKFKMEVRCGMIGVNVGIPAPVASLPFGGMKGSIFSDVKAQGRHAVDFFTEPKIVTERFWEEAD